MDKGVLRSDTVNSRWLQDRGTRVQVIGADVEALYPSLEAVEVAEIVYNAMLETKVKFDNVEWLEACKYIALTSTEQECRLGPLKRVLPRRTKVADQASQGRTLSARTQEMWTSGSSRTWAAMG